MIDRRYVLMGSAALVAIPRAVEAASKSKAVALKPDPFAPSELFADVQRYAGYGIHQTGSPGEVATGTWLSEQLAHAGFTVARQSIETPFFDPISVIIESGELRLEAIVQHPVTPTGSTGITAPLTMRYSSADDDGLAGKIAVVPLPYARHSSAMAAATLRTFSAVKAAGALGLVAVTDGPTGEAIALNADPQAAFAGIPTVIIGSKQAGALVLLAAKGASGRLFIDGKGGHRTGQNVVGQRAGAGKAVVVTTPLSGWFTCAGERGSGVAAWLAFARWLPSAFPDIPFVFAGLVGHEFENLGSEAFLKHLAPTPLDTRLWLHFGSGFAARDWHEVGGGNLLPLPSADSQRFMVASPDIVQMVKQAMRGLPGYESPYPATTGTAAGETRTILAAGYKRVIGNFGGNRFHHTRRDLPDVTSGPLIAGSAVALRDAVTEILHGLA